MSNIADIHTHVETLGFLVRLPGKLQNHLVSLGDHIKEDSKVILSVSLYVNFYQDYKALKNLILRFLKEVEACGEKVVLLKEKRDLQKDFKLGIVLHVESARTLKKFDSQLPELYELGVRGIIPVHFIDNHLGNTCDDLFRRFGLKKSDEGITNQGEKFVELCNNLGLWLDLTHTTDKTGDDMLQIANKVMASHIGIRDLKNIQRNKPIDFLKKIANKGGLIGLSPWQHLVGFESDAYQKHFQFAKDQGLSKNISIGTDFGVPIYTDSKIKSVFDISKVIEDEDFLYNNAFNFLTAHLG